MFKKLQDPSEGWLDDRLAPGGSQLWAQQLQNMAAIFAILAGSILGSSAAVAGEELAVNPGAMGEIALHQDFVRLQKSSSLNEEAIAQIDDSELEQIIPPENPASETTGDPELGTLRLEELEVVPLTAPPQPKVYLLGDAGYLRSNNILSGIDPVDDGLFQAGLTLLGIPYSSSQTSVLAYVRGGFIRYGEQSQFDYNRLNFGASVRQQLFPQTYGELGWSNQQLFREDEGDRFLNDHSAYLKVGRQDALSEQLRLNTFYQFRLSFAEPDSRSQIINTFNTTLQYAPSPPLRLGLEYQLSLADFTQRDRFDTYHQLLARLTYNFSPKTRVELFGGKSFGNSSDSNIDFDGFIFGVNFGFILY